MVELPQQGTGFGVFWLHEEMLLVLPPRVSQMLQSEYKHVESSWSQGGIKLCC